MKVTKKANLVTCKPEDHPIRLVLQSGDLDNLRFERAAGLFRALGDTARLKLLSFLSKQEACVTEIAEESGEGSSTISQRLKLLRAEGIVRRRRQGKHLYYSLVDDHILILIQNALEHAEEKRR